jgi:hypothetical protein
MRYPILFTILFTSTFCLAQACQTYKLFNSGAKLEMSHYDKKGKFTSKTITKVLKVNNEGNNINAEIESVGMDEKGKTQFSGNLNIKCTPSGISLSMKNMLNPDQLKSMKDMEVKIDETMLDYPTSLADGSILKDGTFKAETYLSGMKIMTMHFNISERKVVGKESITIPAGTFDAVKISYKGGFKAIVSMNYDVVEWYSPTYGVLKSESFKDGKSMGYSVLSAIL